ncbi:DUF262 domain-containing protein, partial [Parabacteroides sp. OttesenSCG-928-O15]|nr:DUF262 domain-containing protein [Parabacteroides sp. OttesenSCG-928-O15]
MSYKQTNTQQTTFWSFIRNYKIEIPIIQRDYAQGRVGKEKLRETFLKSLKETLDSRTELTLDFVYGSVENNSLNPLDGQQRLTTLWLLHWYIAYKAGKLSENRDIFKRFSYETRISSREFCIKLSEFSEKDNSKIVELIQKQTWFLSAWKQDPTIQAMLHMLDSIKEIFKEPQCSEYWGLLESDSCPITFYYLNLHDVGLSDDLYIKMNSRGKALTHFENFKADLVGYIKDLKSEKSKEKPQDTIAHKIDTTWTDIFWNFRTSENKIDEIYYEFIHRFIFNGLITAKDGNNKYLYTQDNVTKQDLYLYINKKEYQEYSNFNIYKNKALLNIFTSFEKTMDNFYKFFKKEDMIEEKDKIKRLFTSSWGNKFSFIPEYDKSDVDSITQPHRVLLYAISRYFEEGEYEEICFKRWIRIVWNIVENGGVIYGESMIGAARLIDELANHSHSIYEFIGENGLISDFAEKQMEEERDKINKIRGEKGEDWEII